jgi:hypothetical protein
VFRHFHPREQLTPSLEAASVSSRIEAGGVLGGLVRLTTLSFVLQGGAVPMWVGDLEINGSYAVGQLAS